MTLARLIVALVAASIGTVLALPVILVGLPFWVVKATTRALAHLLEPRYVPSKGLSEYHPVFGWVPKAGVDGYHYVDDVFRVTTDDQGWRSRTTTLAESEIVVLGDSYAWGYGIDDRHFFANRVPQRRVKAVGAFGYNMVQEFLWLQRLSTELRGKLVLWFIYLGNDLFENLVPHRRGYRLPFLREQKGGDDWEVVTSHIGPSKWWYAGRGYGRIYYEQLVAYCTPTIHPRREYAACEALLQWGKDLCDTAGARLIVVSIPDKAQLSAAGRELLLRHGGIPETFDPDLPDRELRSICERKELPFVAGKDHFDVQDYKPHDVHWNERGHQRMAGLIADIYDRYATRSRT